MQKYAENAGNGIAVNKDVVPCEFPQLICCKPSTSPLLEEQISTRSVQPISKEKPASLPLLALGRYSSYEFHIVTLKPSI